MPETTPAPARRADRESVAAALLEAGPAAPTLCEGWSARDLAAHLVLRDGRPDVAVGDLLGRALPPLGRAAAGVHAALDATDYSELVERVRSGPPPWSPARLAPVERTVNAVEFYVHGEDVRRAAPGWAPLSPTAAGVLRPGQREQLWRAARTMSVLRHRRSKVGVVLVVPSGPRAVAHRGARAVVLTGQPEELLLHAFGRRSVAQVEVSGPPEAVAAFREANPTDR